MDRKTQQQIKKKIKKYDLKPKQIEELDFWKNIRRNGIRGFTSEEWRAAHIHFKQYLLMYINRSIADLENRVVVEVGCGPAGIIPYLNNTTTIGVDPLINEYKKVWDLSGDGVKYICSEIEDFELNAQMDVVICWNVLDHVSDIEIATKKLFDMLKSNGELWFMVNLEDPSYFWKVVKGNPDSAHPYKINVISISRLFKKYGLLWKEKVILRDRLNNRPPILMGVLGKNIESNKIHKRILQKTKKFLLNVRNSIKL